MERSYPVILAQNKKWSRRDKILKELNQKNEFFSKLARKRWKEIHLHTCTPCLFTTLCSHCALCLNTVHIKLRATCFYRKRRGFCTLYHMNGKDYSSLIQIMELTVEDIRWSSEMCLAGLLLFQMEMKCFIRLNR